MSAPAASIASMSTQSRGRMKITLQTTRWSAARIGMVASPKGTASPVAAAAPWKSGVGEEEVDRCRVPDAPGPGRRRRAIALAAGSSAAAPSWASGRATSVNRSVGTKTLRSMSIVARGSA